MTVKICNYGVIDVTIGRTALSQAGYLAAIVLRKNGTMETIDADDVPIGM